MRRIELKGNRLTSKGVEAVARGVEGARELSSVNLEWNEVANGGSGGLETLIRAMRKIGTVKYLGLANC